MANKVNAFMCSNRFCIKELLIDTITVLQPRRYNRYSVFNRKIAFYVLYYKSALFLLYHPLFYGRGFLIIAGFKGGSFGK